jgi:hypothetical protein
VKVFPVVIQYSDWKHGGLRSKSVAVQKQLNETAEIIAQYTEGTLETCFFNLWNMWIFDYLLFLNAFLYINGTENAKKSTFFKKYIIVLHYHCLSQK